MALEEDRNTREYLYGRLLAMADHPERRALLVADEYRDTTASRFMQRFADRPYSTWRNMELAVGLYKSRLRAKRGSFLGQMENVLDHILNSFSTADAKASFTNDRPLSGEFLLSYHRQRQALRPKADERATNPCCRHAGMMHQGATHMPTLNNKIEFAIILRISNANPNGDPLTRVHRFR